MTRNLAVPLPAPGRKESSWLGISYCIALTRKILSGPFLMRSQFITLLYGRGSKHQGYGFRAVNRLKFGRPEATRQERQVSVAMGPKP